MWGFILRILWAVAVAIAVWLLCLLFGGLLQTGHQPQVDFVGSFLIANAALIALAALLFAFVGGAPGSVIAFFNRPRSGTPS